MDDRTVHASDGRIEVVRYDKSGKWYVEIPADYGRRGLPASRIHVGVHRAAENAILIEDRGGMIHLGIPGGQAFDRIVVEKQS